jgi:hypothetical protein
MVEAAAPIVKPRHRLGMLAVLGALLCLLAGLGGRVPPRSPAS